MTYIKNKYLYYEKTTEREFWIAWIAIQRLAKFAYKTKRTFLLAGIYIVTTTIKFSFGLIELLLSEPTLYKNTGPHETATEIECAKINWRVL